MAMRCTVCSHEKKRQIDRAIVKSIAHTKIAKTYGVSNQSVRNHAMNHLSKKLLQSEETKELLHSSTLLKEMQELVETAKRILARAESNGHSMISLAAIKELRQIFEFWTKIRLYLQENKDDSELTVESKRKQVEVLRCLSTDELLTMEALWKKATDIYNGVHVVDTIEAKDTTIDRYKRKKRN